MNSEDEHSESEFYYPTEHFTFAVPKRKEVLAPRSAMESPNSPEQFRKFKTLSKVSAQITRQKRQHMI